MNEFLNKCLGAKNKKFMHLVNELKYLTELQYMHFYWIRILFIVFNLNSSALCPIYNGDHKEKSIWNNINGEWGSGEYYRERTYRLNIHVTLNYFLKK
jgi:hypothetical protein